MDATSGTVTPVELVRKLRAPTTTQEDAQEYLLRLLDEVSSNLVLVFIIFILIVFSHSGKPEPRATNRPWSPF